MPSATSTVSYQDSPRYYLITNVRGNAESEIDLHAESWKLPYSIDDSDLTFDGKPLNMLYEENRSMAEHVTYESAKSRSSKDVCCPPTYDLSLETNAR
jgi:hypothetical protein